MIKLVIFDMDGVLVDIKDIHYNTLNESLVEIDPKYYISNEEHLAKFDGKKTYDKLKILTEERSLPIELHKKIWENKQRKTISALHSLLPQKNIIESLRYLKERNITIAVASNSIRNTVKNVMVSTGYIHYVDFFFSNEDCIYGKPNPEIYLRTMITAGVGPSETAIIEDSPTGIEAAERTNAKIIKVNSSKDIQVCLMEKIISEKENNNKWINKDLNVVIPMAGHGSRFAEAGYTFPKPLIEVNGKPMIQTVVENLNIEANYTFIVQAEHYEKYALKYLLNNIAPNCNIVQVSNVTEGAACTVLLAKDYINNDEPLLLANSDQYIQWNSRDFYYSCENSSLDGCILCFNSVHPKWSYVRLNNSGMVLEVAEKKPISDNATVGIYYWKHGSDFVKYAEDMIEKNIRVNNEFYVCPVFNQAIENGKKINTYKIDNMWGLGTPEDLEHYLKNHRGFNK
jgi:HAD superfamily hydrolase (TIGR01509 family)